MHSDGKNSAPSSLYLLPPVIRDVTYTSNKSANISSENFCDILFKSQLREDKSEPEDLSFLMEYWRRGCAGLGASWRKTRTHGAKRNPLR
jgi:hypothetical protein